MTKLPEKIKNTDIIDYEKSWTEAEKIAYEKGYANGVCDERDKEQASEREEYEILVYGRQKAEVFFSKEPIEIDGKTYRISDIIKHCPSD